MYRKLLVACDGSEGSQIAVLHASILAKKLGAELSALWVRGSLPHYPETIDEIDVEEESAYEFFENIKAQLQSVGAGPVTSSGFLPIRRAIRLRSRRSSSGRAWRESINSIPKLRTWCSLATAWADCSPICRR